jgi:hypothetical protein
MTRAELNHNRWRLLVLKRCLGGELSELEDDRPEADFLVMVHKRVRYRTHAFEQFFSNAIQDHMLLDVRIGAEETAWLGQMLFHRW